MIKLNSKLSVRHKVESSRADDRSPAAIPGALKFATGDLFQSELRRRVDEYFTRSGRRLRDCPAMYLKTALVFALLGASYVALVFWAASWWTALPLAIALGLSMAAVGFNVQHDGGHHAYSDRKWVNKLMATSLDLLGASSYVWNKKHNSVHHSYTNVTGHDDDINIGFFGRLSPHQTRLRVHRLQHFTSGRYTGFCRSSGNFTMIFAMRSWGGLGAIEWRGPRAGTWRFSSPAKRYSSRWRLSFRSCCTQLLRCCWFTS